MRRTLFRCCAKPCHALNARFGNEEIGFTTPKAPLFLPSQLRIVGNSVANSAGHGASALPAAGQDVWSAAWTLLVQAMAAPQTNVRQAIQHLLASLGNGDFRPTPSARRHALHNDLIATRKRFYWSDDFGLLLCSDFTKALGTEPETLTVISMSSQSSYHLLRASSAR